jgi:dipeptidyl-peptidase-4
MRRLLLSALLLWSSLVSAERLTIDRIFGDPDLAGPSPRALKIAPDGRHVAFLRGRADDQNQLDLWLYDVAGGKAQRVVDSTSIGERRELSDAEKARRERERIAQLKGIVAYRWSPDGKRLLFTLDERLWLCDPAAPKEKQLRALTPKGLEVIDAKVSPRGGFVSFVSAQNLYAIDLADGRTTQLTRDGGGASTTARPNSSRRKKWIARPATGGRPTTTQSRSNATTNRASTKSNAARSTPITPRR